MILRGILISVPIAWKQGTIQEVPQANINKVLSIEKAVHMETVISEQILGTGGSRHEQEGLPIPKLDHSSPIPVITWQVKMLNRYNC